MKLNKRFFLKSLLGLPLIKLAVDKMDTSPVENKINIGPIKSKNQQIFITGIYSGNYSGTLSGCGSWDSENMSNLDYSEDDI